MGESVRTKCFEKVNFLNVQIDKINMDELTKLVCENIELKRKCLITNHNLHSVYLFQRDEELRKCYELSDYTHIDGMPLVFIGKILRRGTISTHRITYVDWIYPLLEEVNKIPQLNVFYLGSKHGVADKAVEKLKKRYPKLYFKTHPGYFDMNGIENDALIEEINTFGPHILFVGMGMPRQEHWIYKNYGKLGDCIILPCGACFDYISGEVKTPPRWLGKMYLEWLFRFIFEPKRLFFRYFVEPLFLFPIFLKELLKSKN